MVGFRNVNHAAGKLEGSPEGNFPRLPSVEQNWAYFQLFFGIRSQGTWGSPDAVGIQKFSPGE